MTLQRAKAKDYLDPGLFVTEYTDEYVKKHANREPSKRHIYDRRSGIKPDWLKEIENRPAPQINDADLFHTRSASLFKDDFKVTRSLGSAVSGRQNIRIQQAPPFFFWALVLLHLFQLFRMSRAALGWDEANTLGSAATARGGVAED